MTKIVTCEELTSRLVDCNNNPIPKGGTLVTCAGFTDKLSETASREVIASTFKNCDGQPLQPGTTLLRCGDVPKRSIPIYDTEPTTFSEESIFVKNIGYMHWIGYKYCPDQLSLRLPMGNEDEYGLIYADWDYYHKAYKFTQVFTFVAVSTSNGRNTLQQADLLFPLTNVLDDNHVTGNMPVDVSYWFRSHPAACSSLQIYIQPEHYTFNYTTDGTEHGTTRVNISITGYTRIHLCDYRPVSP